MRTEIVAYQNNKQLPRIAREMHTDHRINKMKTIQKLPEIVILTSYPPRECGIATYSQDLMKALKNKFSDSFTLRICALESANEKHDYADNIKYILNTDHPGSFIRLAKSINADEAVRIVLIQHEFGFYEKNKEDFRHFLEILTKPVVIVFHTVLPHPVASLKKEVQELAGASQSVIVMTQSSAKILQSDYDILPEKITVIPHGTHLVPHMDPERLKIKYSLYGKTVLTTFGLLNSGKNIETTLEALPAIVRLNPDVLFIIIGKTHPSVVKQEGERYRDMLVAKVEKLGMQNHVLFIPRFLPLKELLEYLQLTDIYLFTSKDPNQAVSGTFSYAISCGCPIISTPIPHAREVVQNDAGIIIDFENPHQLAEAVKTLLNDKQLRKNISSNGLHRMASTAWENAAVAHAVLFEKIGTGQISLKYSKPAIHLGHLKKMTTKFGIIQFSKINQPDIHSGYTLDDNARALIVMCRHFELTLDHADIRYISIYFNFIKHCLQPEGYFLNYVNENKTFTEQNHSTNLADANGRAIWALGTMISMSELLPEAIAAEAETMLQRAILNLHKIHSTRAMAFIIKGLHLSQTKNPNEQNLLLIRKLADRLVQMYRHEEDKKWQWFESYLTYANSIVPEALLCAWLATGEQIYKDIAKTSFDFILGKTFTPNGIKIISNKGWLHKGKETAPVADGGEQPIDVAYTILALSKFYAAFGEKEYLQKMEVSFSWFLGNNHLHQIIYNPCTGGCYDGLEENYVNLNQGAESTVSYLLARLTMESDIRVKKTMYRQDPVKGQMIIGL